MVNLLKIRELLERKKIRLSEFCSHIGITTQALRDMEKRNSTNLGTLDKIAKYLGVPISYFFEDNSQTGNLQKSNQSGDSLGNASSSGDSISLLKNENDNLHKRVAELNLEIRKLERELGILEGRVMEISSPNKVR